MINSIASQEELLASMGLSTTSTSSPTASKPSVSKFLTNQYPIFSTPLCTVYLQGAASVALASITDEAQWLNWVASNAVYRRIGKQPSSFVASLLTELKDNKGRLFIDREFHRSIVVRLAEAGVAIEPSKAMSRSYALAAIDSYLADLTNYLVETGQTLEDFIESTKPKEKKSIIDSTMSQADFNALFDQL